MLIIGPAGEIAYVNSLAATMFGFERSELLDRSIELLVPPEVRGAHTGHRRNYFDQPRARMMETGLELYGLRKDGSRFPVEISLSPLHTSAGTLVLGAVRDRTRKQKIESEIRALNTDLHARVRDLNATNRELQEFTYTTAHDLRAPVRHMQGYAELLRQSAASRLDESELQQLDKISASAKRLGLLIDSLLDFSRLSRVALRPQQVNLPRLIEELQADLSARNPSRRISWKNSASLPEIQADPATLRILFTNLLDNAVKFTRSREEAVIEVGCADENGTATIFVRDNGVGFDARFSEKLFQLFHRMHRHDEFEGTGIGLAAARRIAERHGGKLWAESELGSGATFYISIPQEDTK